MSKETKIYQIVGVTFDGRQEILNEFYKKTYRVGGKFPVLLLLDNTNKYDKNAISVNLEINGKYENVGFVSKNENVDLRKRFGNINQSLLHSMGPNYRGVIGFSIIVDFDDEIEDLSEV